ncbi:Hypothetical predicted protein [Mytilus galloprovincialis]|uniref:Uncharacterized protein n=1 Tax=Mytilus galloprovincialis TaxID=29158 RepID=A0A8B6C4Z7_MYTGA|nr:Hypothetical predicted protein [Mytilus galloprovincialis]
MEILKVVCLGDPTVKKTDLLSALSEKQCECDEVSCIHNLVKDNFTCNRLISDKLTVEIRLFNTVDSDFIEVDNLRRLQYANADVMLLAFDFNNPATFYSIEDKWVGECLKYSKNAKLLLVGIQLGIRKFHHFRFTSDKVGVVFARETLDQPAKRLALLKESTNVPELLTTLPEVIQPAGLTEEGMRYLYNEVRPFVQYNFRDEFCPRSSEE